MPQFCGFPFAKQPVGRARTAAFQSHPGQDLLETSEEIHQQECIDQLIDARLNPAHLFQLVAPKLSHSATKRCGMIL